MIRTRTRAAAFFACAFLMACAVPATAQDGAAIYKNKCASCHAADGSGKTAAGKKLESPDLRAKEFVEMSDKDMFESIGRGTKHRNYPHSFLYTGLNESQVRAMVSYIRGLQQSRK
jgi:mono/diheme cytochrome c family protein